MDLKSLNIIHKKIIVFWLWLKKIKNFSEKLLSKFEFLNGVILINHNSSKKFILFYKKNHNKCCIDKKTDFTITLKRKEK